MRALHYLLISALLLGMAPAMANASGPPVKKSRSNICHAAGSTYYAQTKNYTPYQTMQACLNSGGRRPKR